MDSLLLTAALLACPVGMGLMMWMMMRGQGKNSDHSGQREVAQLRAEIDQLKTQRAGLRKDGIR